MTRALGILLRIGVSVSILGVIVSRISLEESLARAARGTPGYLAGALALSFLGVVLVALRWRLIAGWLGLAMPAALAVRALFLAVFGGQVLPSAVGTDLLRGWLLARHASGVSRVVASLMVDRLVALFAACVLVLASHRGIVGIAAVLASGGVLCAVVLGLCRGMKLPLRLGPSALAVAIGLAVQAGTVGMAALAARAYGIDASLALWLSVIPLSVIASALPVSLNGWGVREAAIVVLAGPLGVPAADALVVSVTLGVLNMLSSLPGALVMVEGRRRDLV